MRSLATSETSSGKTILRSLIFSNVWKAVSPLNGTFPVSIWNMITPNAQRSELFKAKGSLISNNSGDT